MLNEHGRPQKLKVRKVPQNSFCQSLPFTAKEIKSGWIRYLPEAMSWQSWKQNPLCIPLPLSITPTSTWSQASPVVHTLCIRCRPCYSIHRFGFNSPLLPAPEALNGSIPATATSSPGCQSLSLGHVPRWAQSAGRKYNLTNDGGCGGGKWKFTISVHSGTSDALLCVSERLAHVPIMTCP